MLFLALISTTVFAIEAIVTLFFIADFCIYLYASASVILFAFAKAPFAISIILFSSIFRYASAVCFCNSDNLCLCAQATSIAAFRVFAQWASQEIRILLFQLILIWIHHRHKQYTLQHILQDFLL